MHSNGDAREKKNGRNVDFPPTGASRLRMEPGESSEKPDPMNEFRGSVKAVADALTEFTQARVEAARVHVQSVALKVILGVFGGVAGLVFLVVSIVLLLEGLAGGVSRAMNAAPWVGYLIVGMVCVGVPTAVLLIKIKKLKAQWLKGLKEKYAGRTEICCKK